MEEKNKKMDLHYNEETGKFEEVEAEHKKSFWDMLVESTDLSNIFNI